MGRPIDNPKTVSLSLRLAQNEANKLRACADKLKTNRTTVIAKGIELVEREIKLDNMKIIDSHAHIYPDRIAEKAARAISEFYGVPMAANGTLSSLFAAGDKAGIERFVVHSVATTPRQAISINRFLAQTTAAYPERLTGLGALHPASETLVSDIEYIKNNGLKGVKIHPDFQRFNLDSPEAFALFEALEGVLPVLIHTGDSRTDFSSPKRLKRVLRAFPRLKVIAAHFGGWSVWQEAARVLGGMDLFVDTSSSLYALSVTEAEELVRAFTPERVLFGVDYPMWNHME
ncbi:MAG: amidohydrolase family protein, partial [Oscillospiraceae bacterium]|nr:amidohydrolase family protein [Oscillospiraceae bacterium]